MVWRGDWRGKFGVKRDGVSNRRGEGGCYSAAWRLKTKEGGSDATDGATHGVRV